MAEGYVQCQQRALAGNQASTPGGHCVTQLAFDETEMELSIDNVNEVQHIMLLHVKMLRPASPSPLLLLLFAVPCS